MGKVAAVLLALLIVGGLWWLNDAMTTQNNITCVKQTGVVGHVKYELCIAGQSQPQYVPYSVWRTAKVGGYYDEGSHSVFKSADDDPHVSHGIGGDDGSGGHSVGHSVGHGGGGE